MITGGFRLDLLLETAGLARSTYYYQLKQLDGFDKDEMLQLKKSLDKMLKKLGR